MIELKQKDFSGYMPDVQKYDKSISLLNDQWDNLKLLCEINCPIESKNLLPNMTKIQNSFYNLQSELINALTDEEIKKMEQKIISKAQVAIDILIRNLYERTADVGFLATDNDIKKFVSAKYYSDNEKAFILNRLKSYVAKYSVYDEIIILDNDFNVLINLDPENEIAGLKINDEILEKTISSEENFIESFCFTNLQKNKNKSHIFSSKIFDNSNNIIGIICLSFRFENEMDRIFENLMTNYDGSVIMIIDEDNVVLSSSDENNIPSGIKIESAGNISLGVQYYRGLAYITKTVSTKGYQNYYGLGWKGQVILPLHLAFKEKIVMESLDSSIVSGLMSMADSFSAALKDIIEKTDVINSSLKRIVYNGQILSRDKNNNEEYLHLKPILNAIGRVGNKTSSLFQKSVSNLFSTVVSTSLGDVSFLASLCIDIMDRNLYERADDCRWWALNSDFRRVLSKNNLTDYDKKEITDKLSYINSLYTVYTNLFLFDSYGTIIAVSNPKEASKIGMKLTDEYVRNILANSNPEKYFVSDFKKTNLYEDKFTYVYGASITDIDDNKKTVGGIGIVFDSEYQFETMLKESLETNKSSFAVFTDRNGLVISSTNPEITVGSSLNVENSLFEIENGNLHSQIIIFNNFYYSVGVSCSKGYREYKCSDGYKNDILAFVFEKLANYIENEDFNAKNEVSIEQSDVDFTLTEEHKKFATFSINNQILGIDHELVLEAMDGTDIVSLPGESGAVKGVIEYKNNYIAVIDINVLLCSKKTASALSSLLVVKGPGNETVALQVEKLNNVLEINIGDIKPVSVQSLVTGVVCVNDESGRAVLILDSDILLSRMNKKDLKEDWQKTINNIKELNLI